MTQARHILFASLIVLLPLTASFAAQSKPKLTVLIVVDQMRDDYLSRQQSLFAGGFKRLLDQGMRFTQTYHEHAVTETGVGHATIATGCYPARHGIVSNEWRDTATARWIYCVEDSTRSITNRPGSAGRSPDRLRRPTFGDWLRRSSLNSKVFGVTGKDRSSILMSGFTGSAAYWYNANDGTMVTSTYYLATYPAWVDSFNNEHPADDYFVGIWDRLLPKDKYSGRDSVAAEYDGKRTVFPHDFSAGPNDEPNKYYDYLRYTPYADHLLLRFSRDLVINEKLGADDDPDLLMIGCSAGDYIGHRYGPSSHELQDHYLRLDQYLGAFFAFLDSTVGADQYALALTGDHGVVQLPEELKKQGVDAGRIHSDSLAAAIKRVGAKVATEMSCSTNVVLDAGDGVFLNYAEPKSRGREEPFLRNVVAEKLKQLPFVADAYTREALSASGDSARTYIHLFRNNYYPSRSPDIMLRFKENWIISDSPHGTSHGSPYDYDRHVPLIFFGAGISPGIDSLKAATVDIVPTLSELIGVAPPQDISGKSLVGRLKR